MVTGGAGFIGSHIVDDLARIGHDVLVVDCLLDAAHSAPPTYLNGAAQYVRVDVTDRAAMTELLAGCEAVCHQAAMVGLGVDFADADRYVLHNDLGTATLLAALHDVGFGGRIVLASSMVVYGEGRYRCPTHGVVRPGPRARVDLDLGRYEPPCEQCGDVLRSESVPEDAPLDPRNVYAATKLHQEFLCRSFVREHPEVTCTALRYHNVYGPRMPRNTPYAGVASIFRSALERGEPPIVLEDGEQRRDFVHVRDVARANVLALTNEQPFDGPLNVASGHPRTVGAMAHAMCHAFGTRTSQSAVAPRFPGGYRLGDVRHVVADATRAAETIGFRAQVSFEDGVDEFVTAALR